jgi:hypothetical protein
MFHLTPTKTIKAPTFKIPKSTLPASHFRSHQHQKRDTKDQPYKACQIYIFLHIFLEQKQGRANLHLQLQQTVQPLHLANLVPTQVQLPQGLTGGKPVANPDNPVGVQVEDPQAGELPEALDSCQLVEGEVQVVEASGKDARGDVGCKKWTGGGQ